jgi:purine-binding chemotaxis protein CheW
MAHEEPTPDVSVASPSDDATDDRVPYLGFFLGSYVYGLPVAELRGVTRLDQLRRVPGAPASVAGLVNLRGELVCALDTCAILGLNSSVPVRSSFLVVLRGPGDPIGLVVDAITDVYAIDPGQVTATPAGWPSTRTSFLKGAVPVPAGTMGLLDLERVTTR